MILSDTTSASNPALCSLILRNFLIGFEKNNKSGCELPVLFLVLPLILSKDIRSRFKGTNSSTGLITWISREPQMLLNLAKRIEITEMITREAIIFGITNDVIKLNEDGHFNSDNKGIVLARIKSTIKTDNQPDISEMIKTSEIFGKWCGQLKDSTILYNVMGLTL